MSRNVTLHGGVNTIQGDVYILEVHGGVINLYGRAGAINQFGGVMNDKRSQSSCQGTDPRQTTAKVLSPGSNWDVYKPTKAECEAVYKNFKVWLECEEELEPINL